MHVLKRLRPVAAIMLTAALASCSDALSPDTVDPVAFQTKTETITSTFNSASFQSLTALSGKFPSFGAVAALRAGTPVAPSIRGMSALAQRERRANASQLLASLTRNPQALFPVDVLGKTFEWNTTSHTYVAGTLPGAPTSGIRILLYTVNVITGEPVSTQQLGYVELTDQSSPQADKLGVLVTLGSTTIANYAITAVFSTVTVDVTAIGFIKGATGSTQVNFDFEQFYNDNTEKLTTTSDLHTNDNSAITVDFSGDPDVASFDIGLTGGHNTLSMAVTLGTTDAIAGGVKYNGTTVATIGGIVDAPTFTGVSGRSLQPGEIAALVAIFSTAVDISLVLIFAVMAPGLVVF